MSSSVTFDVLYKDKAAFERKKAKLIQGGIDRIQVIADFDRCDFLEWPGGVSLQVLSWSG
jgi:hypothetical protein